MSAFGKAWVRVAEGAKRGEPIEIRAMIMHPMESGFRLDNVGRPFPRHIVSNFVCTYDGRQVFRATLHPAMSANPYFRRRRWDYFVQHLMGARPPAGYQITTRSEYPF